jgi:hypothetical protein
MVILPWIRTVVTDVFVAILRAPLADTGKEILAVIKQVRIGRRAILEYEELHKILLK